LSSLFSAVYVAVRTENTTKLTKTDSACMEGVRVRLRLSINFKSESEKARATERERERERERYI
jgi:hypothetical protein